MADRIQIRRDTAANWTSANPTLAQGELGVETDTLKFKVGDGSTAWNSVNYLITSTSGNVVSTDEVQTLTNKTVENGTFTNGYTEEVNTANTGSAYTIDLADGSFQILTLTASATITMPTAVAGKSFLLLLKQDATGSRTVTWSTVSWPAGVAPTITSTANKQDIFAFYSDGTNWYGLQTSADFTV